MNLLRNNTFALNRTKKSMIILNILFTISLSAMNILLYITGSIKWMVVSFCISVTVFLILIFKKNFLEDKLTCRNKFLGLSALFFALVSDIYFAAFFYRERYGRFVQVSEKLNMSIEEILILGKIATVILGLIALPAIFILWNYIFNKYSDSLKRFILSFDKIEKNFIVITGVIFTLIVTAIYLKTNVFYLPTFNNELVNYDVVYTTDSGNQIFNNVFMNIGAAENDLRQPLFGVYALPFGVISAILSKIFFFIPNSYSIALAIVQFLVLDVSIICISRILKVQGIEKALFLIINICTYPFLLFSLNMEQYVFAVFWMILFLYAVIEDKKYRDILYIGATGSMLSSGVYFVLLSKSREFKKYIKDIASVCIKFFVIVIMASRLQAFLCFSNSLQVYEKFVGADITFYDKLLQYINFIGSCFIKPETYIDKLGEYNHISYLLVDVTKVNLLGIIILVLSVLGFWLNHKNKFARICLGWILYSFILLCLVGWGISENGLVLYSLYFSWAFITLTYMCINKIFEKVPKIKLICLGVLILVLLVVNIPGILDLVKFGIKYYPTSI